jgi:hypothetical protein
MPYQEVTAGEKVSEILGIQIKEIVNFEKYIEGSTRWKSLKTSILDIFF